MKVSLIFTPNQLNPNFRELAFRDDSLGFVPPLSLMHVAALMEQAGAQVEIIDMVAERLSYPAVLDRLRRFSPDLLGFTITTSSFHAVLTWINRFKADTGLPILAGGEHVRLYPHETMSHSAIDFCIVGEAEYPIPLFISAFKNRKPYSGIKSFGYRSAGAVFIDCSVKAIDDLDSIPFPARHLIKNNLYENIFTRRKNFTAMISSRGCPFNCAFCCSNHQLYRTRSPQNFVDEIELNLREYDIHDFDIYDSTFTADRQRVMEICRLIQKRQLPVSFTVRSRVDVVNRDMIDALRSAGCHAIMYGIESSNPEILAAMHKGISPGQVMETVAYTKSRGIETLGFFMFGFPGETLATIEDTIDFSLRLPLDYAQYTLLLPFPETEIYSYYRSRGLEDYWAEYTLDASRERLIEFIDTAVTRQQASAMVSLAYKRFYFRPGIIWHRLLRLRSTRELKRLAGGAFGILTNSRDND